MAENPTPGAELLDQLAAEKTKTNELAQKLFAETEAHKNTKQEHLKANTTIEGLNKQLATETTAHTATKQELAEANTFVDQLNQQLNEKAAGGPAAHIVTLGVASNAKKYRVTLPKFNYKGKIYNAEDVKSNSDLLKELVEKGVVVELVEAAK